MSVDILRKSETNDEDGRVRRQASVSLNGTIIAPFPLFTDRASREMRHNYCAYF